MREELKCAEMMNGVQSVMMDGAPMMPEWSVDNWDLKPKVCYCGETQGILGISVSLASKFWYLRWHTTLYFQGQQTWNPS